jgi:hypothetical protein
MKARIESVKTDDEKVFIFEECLYILKKWPELPLMESFVTRLVPLDNSSFVLQYLTHIDTLDTLTLDHIMMVGGCNPEPFLCSIITNLEGKTVLSQNMKHLLENMNLAWCSELNEKLYLEVLEKIRNLSGISTEDLKFVLELAIETTRLVSSRREERKERTTEIYNVDKSREIFNNCDTLSAIQTALFDGKVRSVFHVVEILLKIYFLESVSEDSQNMFISTLENICGDRKLHKVSKQHLELIINALKYSPFPRKTKLIAMLNNIKSNDKLSTCHENIEIFCDKFDVVTSTGKMILGIVKDFLTRDDSVPAGTVYKFHFPFRHPSVRECQEPGKCGFIVSCTIQDDICKNICTLYTENKHYTGTELHAHEIVSASYMCICNINSVITAPNNKISVVWSMYWSWWENWLPNFTTLKLEELCIDYNVSDYTVFKRK